MDGLAKQSTSLCIGMLQRKRSKILQLTSMQCRGKTEWTCLYKADRLSEQYIESVIHWMSPPYRAGVGRALLLATFCFI
jgi:hypothetical protein